MAEEKEAPASATVIAALGLGESGPDLIRAASALARASGADLDCVTIDTGADASAEEGERMAEALRLARGLGARVSSEPDVDVAAGLRKYAELRDASTVVVGAGRRGFLGLGIADRLLSSPRSFSVVAISGPRSGIDKPKAGARPPFGESAGQYVAAILIVSAVTGLNLALAGYAGYWAAAITYLAAISLAALALDRWPVLFAALLSAIAWDFFFIPPRFTMRISRTADLLMLVLYFLVALCSGWMTGRLRTSERLLAARESRMSRLSSLAQALAGAKTIASILDTSIEAIKEAFSVEATVILRETGGGLKNEAESGWEPLDANAWEAARMSFEGLRSAGRFTDAFPASEWHFVPMEGPRGCLGVIGLRAAHDRVWDEGLESFLRTIALTVSIAVARELAES